MSTENPSSLDTIILPSWPEILPSLHLIENSASQIFSTLPSTSFLASEPGLSVSEFTHHHDLGLLWVALFPQSLSAPSSQPRAPKSSEGHRILVSTIQHHPDHPAYRPVGFLAAHLVNSYLHVEEIDVSLTHQGRGIAGKLMLAAEDEARRRGLQGVSLVTSKLTPWSYEWYLRIGFCEVPEAEAAEGLGKVLKQERENWAERREWAESRVIMIREF